MGERQIPEKSRLSYAGQTNTNQITTTQDKEVSQNPKSVASSVAQVTFAQWSLILALIFGGCCSNVFTLEAIVS